MYDLSQLVGNGPESGIVHEVIRRDMNPANVHEIDEKIVPYMLGVCGVEFLVSQGLVTDPENITPEEFREYITPRLIRTGVDAAIVKVDGFSLRTVNKEKQPNYCAIDKMPRATIDQINTSHRMVDYMKDQIIAQIPKRIGQRELKREEKWVYAAHIMAKMAYGEKERQSGRLYLTHPEEIAAIANHMVDQLIRQGFKVSDSMRGAFVVTALLHDALEEWRKPENYYNLKGSQLHHIDNQVLTPLVIKTTMNALGMNEGASDYLANAVRLMTHEKGGDWMLTFLQYLHRGSGNRLVGPIKLVDMFHNLTVEPKPVPKQKVDMTDQQYQDKLVYYDFHRGEYYYYLYEDGYRKIKYEKNAFIADPKLSVIGGQWINTLSGLAYPDNPPKRISDPNVIEAGGELREIDPDKERKGRMLGSEFAQNIIPILNNALSQRYRIELVQSAEKDQ